MKGNQTVELMENMVKEKLLRGIKKYKDSKIEEYILISSYFNMKAYKLQLIDILNDQIIHTWDPSNFALSTSEASARYTFEHSKLLDNGDVLISSGNKPILRINPCSEINGKAKSFTPQ